jgi:glycerol-3-phosphate acyltransferase PlsY
LSLTYTGKEVMSLIFGVEFWQVIFIIFFSYFCGSIPFGYIIGKYIKGVDIRKTGSGNIGGTNVWRKLGFKYGVLVVALDIFKGVMPVIVAMYFLKGPWWLIGSAFLCCFLGSIFPVWLKFKGGKGVSVFLGGLLGLAGPIVCLIVFIVWLIAFIFFTRRKVSTTNLVIATALLLAAIVVPILAAIFPILVIVVLLIWWTHRENIERILRNNEPSPKNLPPLFDKLPDNVIALVVEKLPWITNKLQSLTEKLRSYQNKKKP